MGEPQTPFSFLPPIWAEQAILKELPSEPDLAPSHAYWIENMGAWIAADEEDAEYLRDVLGDSARILTPSEFPVADPHFGTNEEMLAWCEDEKIIPIKDETGISPYREGSKGQGFTESKSHSSPS